MKKQLFNLLAMLFIGPAAFSQTTSVSYHTNHFTSQYGTAGALPSTDFSRIVTRFTPTVPYPCQLVKMKAWFRNCLNPSQFNWVVYKDATGMGNGPGTSAPVYLSTGNYTNPAQGGIQDSAYVDSVDLTAQNIILTSGDVYAGVTEHLQQNMFIGIAVDTANTSTPDRNWVYSGAWYKAVNWIFADASWGITAYFTGTTATDVNELNSIVGSVELFPQPARTEATISYELKDNAVTTLAIYNQLGEKVMENLPEGFRQQAGRYEVTFPMSQLREGIYIVRLESNSQFVSRKLVVVR